MRNIFSLLLTSALLTVNPPATDRPNSSASILQSGTIPTPLSPEPIALPKVKPNQKSRKQATKVTTLKKDDSGVWRRKASKGGSMTDVSLDFQGNVNSAK
jgi:hypothetical protein